MCIINNSNNKIALKSGNFFMIFEKDDILFFDDLKKTNQVVCVDDEDLNLYEASNCRVAQQVDELLGKESRVYYTDEYVVDKNINI